MTLPHGSSDGFDGFLFAHVNNKTIDNKANLEICIQPPNEEFDDE
jgi:hypothetical protein